MLMNYSTAWRQARAGPARAPPTSQPDSPPPEAAPRGIRSLHELALAVGQEPHDGEVRGDGSRHGLRGVVTEAPHLQRRQAVLCYAMLCYAMLCYAMLCYAMLCYAMLCYAMRCDAMRCDAMRCDAMRCDASLRYAMPRYYAMLYLPWLLYYTIVLVY